MHIGKSSRSISSISALKNARMCPLRYVSICIENPIEGHDTRDTSTCVCVLFRRIFSWFRAFERFDRDGSGFLSKSEFAEALKASGISVTGADIGKFFKKLDKNCDESIDFKVHLSLLYPVPFL